MVFKMKQFKVKLKTNLKLTCIYRVYSIFNLEDVDITVFFLCFKMKILVVKNIKNIVIILGWFKLSFVEYFL